VGLLVSLFLILVARPVGVLISLSFFRMKMRRRLYISWVGLRGAAPIVFATYPLLAGMDKANMIFNIVFFISVTSVMIQGTTISTFAKWLNVALPDGSKILTPTDTFLADNPKAAMKEIEITPACRSVDRKIVDLHFPGNAIIAMIHRDGTYLVPNGSTEIRAGDTLIVLSDTQDGLDQVDACLLRSEPAG